MNFGELAEAEAPSIAAYKLVNEIEREFKAAADLDEHFDYAGPARCLGLLYRDAPGWPISIGSKHKAREWLERAAAARAGLSRKPVESRRIAVCAGSQRAERGTGVERAGRHLARRPNQFHRRSLGAKLGRLDPPADRAARADFQKTFKRRPVKI